MNTGTKKGGLPLGGIENGRKEKGNLGMIGQNPYVKGQAALSILLEVPINGTETVMEVWHRTRDLKRVGRYLTLYK